MIDNAIRLALAITSLVIASRSLILANRVHGIGRRIIIGAPAIPLATFAVFWMATLGLDISTIGRQAWMLRLAFLVTMATFWLQQRAIKDAEEAEARNGGQHPVP